MSRPNSIRVSYDQLRCLCICGTEYKMWQNGVAETKHVPHQARASMIDNILRKLRILEELDQLDFQYYR